MEHRFPGDTLEIISDRVGYFVRHYSMLREAPPYNDMVLEEFRRLQLDPTWWDRVLRDLAVSYEPPTTDIYT